MGKAVPKTAKRKARPYYGPQRMVSEPEISTNLSLGTVRGRKIPVSHTSIQPVKDCDNSLRKEASSQQSNQDVEDNVTDKDAQVTTTIAEGDVDRGQESVADPVLACEVPNVRNVRTALEVAPRRQRSLTELAKAG
jgi:hypothetical protein